MAQFLTKLDVEAINDSTWRLTSSLLYGSDLVKYIIGVKKGFVTDFASVPRLPLVFLIAGDVAHEAAAVHDYLYQTHIVEKQLADKIFYEAMKVTGIPEWRARIMYCAVATFGGSAWNSGLQRYTILNGPA